MSSLVLVLAGGLLAAACDEAPTAAAPPPPPEVTVATPLVKQVQEWDEYTGRFEAVELVDLRARVSGYLDSIHFKDGEMVQKGQLMFTIDPRPYQIAIEQAQGAVAKAEALATLAGLEADRAAKLVGNSVVSRATYDQRQQEKESADADVAEAKARLDKAKLDLTFTQIIAPVEGRTSNRRVDVGNLVMGDLDGATPLTTIVSLDPIYFVFDASEADYLRYQQLARDGERQSSRDAPNPVYVRLTDEEGWPHKGHMDFVDNVVDRSTGTIRGRAVFDNADQQLTPGVFGRLRIVGSGLYDAVMIPDEAIMADQSDKIVYVVGDDGTVAVRKLQLGPIIDGLRVVRSGLEGKERVIINGLLRARPGGKVTAKEGRIEAVPDGTG
ncbi:MAG: efflux RND transporter periplasmic adaptor subunit [Geminicoccaceae bacterium]